MAPFIPLTEESFNITTHFFVPCGSLQTYLRQMWWRDFHNSYTPIEEMPAVAVLVDASEGGTASVLQEPTCDSPTAIIEAVADSGYHFTAWSDGDTNALRTLTVGATDIVLTALFASDTSDPDPNPDPDPESIDNIDISGVTISVIDRCITVSGTDQPVKIYDIMGRTAPLNTALLPGVYIVRIGATTARKVIVF